MRKKLIWAVGIWIVMGAVVVLAFLYTRNHPAKEPIEDERITHYYRGPQPGQLIPILESSLKEKDLLNHRDRLDSLVHFNATVLQANKDKLKELKDLEKSASGKDRQAIQAIIAEAENYGTTDLKSPKDLEVLWAEFKATGKEEIIQRILGVVDSRTTGEPRKLSDAAKAFLIKKAPFHTEVLRYLSKEPREEALRGEIAEILKTVTTSTNPWDLHNERGRNFANLRKYEDALKEYETALTYYPDSCVVHFNMALVYEMMGKMKEAFAFNQKAARIDPEEPSISYNLGRHYNLLKRPDEAIQCYLKALESEPDNPLYNHAIARTYQDRGDKENAVLYFRKYLEYAPNGEHVVLVKKYLASVGVTMEDNPSDPIAMMKKRAYGDLEKYLASLLTRKDKSEEGISYLSVAYQRLCLNEDIKYKYELWTKYFGEWVKHNPSSHFANACAGIFYVRYAWDARGSGWGNTVVKEGAKLYQDRLLAAKDYLDKAYQLNASDPAVPAWLITAAMGLGLEEEEMEQQFRRAVKADKTDYDGYKAKLVYLAPKWHGSAEKMFRFAREAARQAPAGSMVPVVLAAAHWEMYYGSRDQDGYFKDPRVWEEVKEVYSTVAKAFPNSKNLHNRFAAAAYLAGDRETARRELERIKNDYVPEVWGSRKYFEAVKKEVLGG
jgi:tetratricopeptide (TPR) repeat protein